MNKTPCFTHVKITKVGAAGILVKPLDHDETRRALLKLRHWRADLALDDANRLAQGQTRVIGDWTFEPVVAEDL